MAPESNCIRGLTGMALPAIVLTLQLSSEKSLTIKALYTIHGSTVEVIDERELFSYVKFADDRCIWVRNDALDFDNVGDDDWGPENDDDLGFDSPTDSDEHEMNYDDSYYAGDYYDMEYDY